MFKSSKCPKPVLKYAWPRDCQAFTANVCNQYELSPDGSEILSCFIPEMCMAEKTRDRCTKYYDDASILEYQLDNCAIWYDGCKECNVMDGALTGCKSSYLFCGQKSEPYCVKKRDRSKSRQSKESAPAYDFINCKVWFDGCNTCKVHENGLDLSCTKHICSQQKKSKTAFCSERIIDES
jgi:hypothetical protein